MNEFTQLRKVMHCRCAIIPLSDSSKNKSSLDFIETFGRPWRRGEANNKHLVVMVIYHRDFILNPQQGIGIPQLVVLMHNFFTQHPQYRMTDYEPISHGLRAYYEVIQ